MKPYKARKRDTHLRFIRLIKSLMPVTKICVEIGLFDPHLMKAVANGQTLEGEEYQHGEAEGFENMMSYIRYRDNYTCQNPDCRCHKMKEEQRKELRVFVHHIGYWKKDRTNRPGNLITLCELSHTPENHQKGGLLYGWEPKIKPMKEPAFMNLVRKEIVEELKKWYSDMEVTYTYGYKTNLTRNEWKISKSHSNDAFCIAGNDTSVRTDVLYFKQHRRNNRSLEKFYDAKYIDSRDGKKKSGKTLFNGRTTRNKNHCSENLHPYRKQKIREGSRSIRKNHYMIQPNDMVWFESRKYKAKGIHCKGSRLILEEGKSVSVKKVSVAYYNRGVS